MFLQKKKGLFHHSSFLAGGATLAAGRLVAEDGVLKVLYEILLSNRSVEYAGSGVMECFDMILHPNAPL